MSNMKATSRKRSIASSIHSYLASTGQPVDSSVVDHLTACHEQFVQKLAGEIVKVGSQRSENFQAGTKDVTRAMQEMGLDEILEAANSEQPKKKKSKTKRKVSKTAFTDEDAAEQDRLLEASKAKMIHSTSH